MSERHRGFEVGSDDAAHTILWLHGYTGSPDAFFHSAERFADKLDAKVIVPLLPGHGTDELHLPPHTFEDFLVAARHFHEHALSREKPLALIGYSLGGHLALLLSQSHMPRALVLALTPYRLRFPFRVPGFPSILRIAPFWGKHLTREDIDLRRGTFYYPDVPGKSLSMICEGNKRVESILPNLSCPILTVHNEDDPLAAPESGEMLLAKSGRNPANECRRFPHDRHTFFMGKDREVDELVVTEFLARHFQKENVVE